MSSKRIRIFAGPNGSGKTTIFQTISQNYPSGIFINADVIESILKKQGVIHLNKFGITATQKQYESFYLKSTFPQKAANEKLKIDLTFDNNVIINKPKKSNSYESAFLAEFIREMCLKQRISFSYETVMSHKSKIVFLKKARKMGYKVYLYFICTSDPMINVARVGLRVKKGGHPVPKNKIFSRYTNSCALLKKAVPYTYRTFVFDNSLKTSELILDVFNGNRIELHKSNIPDWVRKSLFN